MEKIDTGYHPVYIGEDCLEQMVHDLSGLQPDSIFILTDQNTARHCYPKIRRMVPAHTLIRIKSGEKNKDLKAAASIWKALSKASAGRKAVLINLGGGLVTDIGGFASSAYKRGIRFINIPTSLLAQVDASSGGKTGIDLDGWKNQIGSFAFPEAVYIDPRFLKTLPKRELNSGWTESLKHGLIADAGYWNALRQLKTSDLISSSLIKRSVEIKARITSEDPKEKGLRKILNFGHTMGHAFESAYLKSRRPLLHGEAIAAGMICEAYLSRKCLGLSDQALQEIVSTLRPVVPVREIRLAKNKLFGLLQQDKKNQYREISFSLLRSIGEACYDQHCPPDLILESVEFFNEGM